MTTDGRQFDNLKAYFNQEDEESSAYRLVDTNNVLEMFVMSRDPAIRYPLTGD